MRAARIFLAFVTAALAASGASALADEKILRLATTTSTDNSGLLKSILPAFEQSSGYSVHVIAVGTGKALRMGQDGDVDVVLVHAPPAEERFMANGFGVHRRYVMYNDFVLVGPAHDPAGVRALADVSAALAQIAGTESLFLSRGDDSGTDKKEKELWRESGLKPQGPWYRAAGQSMGKVLLMADELKAYTLVDRGTWLAMQDKVELEVLVHGDRRLFNPYHVMAVNPARYPDVNHAGAVALINWITSVDGQGQIARFRVSGKKLFVPTVLPARLTSEGGSP